MSTCLDSLLDAGRLLDIAANDAAMSRMFRVQGDWYGGGFGYTLPFATDAEARAWGEHKARFHPDAVITVIERARATAASPQPGEGQHAPQGIANSVGNGIGRLASVVLLHLAAALFLLVTPRSVEAAAMPRAQAAAEAIELHDVGRAAADPRRLDLPQQPRPYGTGSVIEFLAEIAPQGQPVTHPQAQEKRQDRNAGVLQRLYHDHPYLCSLVLLLAGIVIGAGGDVTILQELYRQPRELLVAEVEIYRARHKPHPRQRGNGTPGMLLGVGLFAVALGVIGPALDREPYGTRGDQERDYRRAAAALVTRVSEQCRQAGGPDSSWTLSTTHGQIACVDAAGRLHRHVVTILHRSTP